MLEGEAGRGAPIEHENEKWNGPLHGHEKERKDTTAEKETEIETKIQ